MKISIVKALPKRNQAVGLISSAGLLPSLVACSTREALVGRLRIDDPVVRVWALGRLLDKNLTIPEENSFDLTELIKDSGFLRRLLVGDISRGCDLDRLISFERMETAAHTKGPTPGMNLTRALAFKNHEAAIEAYNHLYLDTGDTRWLFAAVELARAHLTWEAGLPCFVRAMYCCPSELDNLLTALILKLHDESATAALRIFGKISESINARSFATIYARASIAEANKKHSLAIEMARAAASLSPSDPERLARAKHLEASACEKVDRDSKAISAYDQQNAALSSIAPAVGEFQADVNERADVPAYLEESGQASGVPVILTSFPRSATTLIGSLLNRHPDIKVLEETSSFSLTYSLTKRVKSVKNSVPPESAKSFLNYHRTAYLQNLKRDLGKSSPEIVIDKTPILSAEAVYLNKLLPEAKYVFMIRDPRDVVVSNYKQVYKQNKAMANFNHIRTACDLYDFAMSKWFSVHSMGSPRVKYIFYENLITNQDAVLTTIYDFLNVTPITGMGGNTVELTQGVAARTPSYRQIRDGIDIKPRSSWQRFEVLFDDYCRSKLDPWVEFFGYTVEEPKQ